MSTRRHRKADLFPLANLRARVGRLSTLVTVLAVFLQAFVVQTHVDGLAGLGSIAAIERTAGGAPQASVSAGASHDAQSACPVCLAMATAGTTLLSMAPSLLTAHGLIAHEARIEIRRVPMAPAHAWQSRAPPIAL